MAVSLGATIQPTTGPSVAGSTGIFLPHLAHRFLIFMGSSLLLLEFFWGVGLENWPPEPRCSQRSLWAQPGLSHPGWNINAPVAGGVVQEQSPRWSLMWRIFTRDQHLGKGGGGSRIRWRS